MPKELALAVVILLALETRTPPPVPPVPPVPPRATEIAASGATAPEIAKPPLPPPPPIDCAMMPVEFSPAVVNAPFVVTLTEPALLPAPPSPPPPSETLNSGLPLRESEKPPLPPPPPIDCPTIAAELSPKV